MWLEKELQRFTCSESNVRTYNKVALVGVGRDGAHCWCTDPIEQKRYLQSHVFHLGGDHGQWLMPNIVLHSICQSFTRCPCTVHSPPVLEDTNASVYHLGCNTTCKVVHQETKQILDGIDGTTAFRDGILIWESFDLSSFGGRHCCWTRGKQIKR